MRPPAGLRYSFLSHNEGHTAVQQLLVLCGVRSSVSKHDSRGGPVLYLVHANSLC